MDGCVYLCKKHKTKQERKMQNEVPFPEPAIAIMALKAMASGKSPMKSVKSLHKNSNCVVDSNE